MQNAECRVQNAERRMQNAECRMKNAECQLGFTIDTVSMGCENPTVHMQVLLVDPLRSRLSRRYSTATVGKTLICAANGAKAAMSARAGYCSRGVCFSGICMPLQCFALTY